MVCSENCSVAHQHLSPKFPLIHTQDPDDHNDDGNDGNDVEDGSAGGIVSTLPVATSSPGLVCILLSFLPAGRFVSDS